MHKLIPLGLIAAAVLTGCGLTGMMRDKDALFANISAFPSLKHAPGKHIEVSFFKASDITKHLSGITPAPSPDSTCACFTSEDGKHHIIVISPSGVAADYERSSTGTMKKVLEIPVTPSNSPAA